MAMIKTNRFWLAAATLLLASCTVDELVALDGRTPVRLTVAQLSVEPTTRAGSAIQGTQLDEGESFYAYFPENVSVSDATSDCHTTFTVTDAAGNTTPATQPYFNPGQTTATVHAYYPSTITNTTYNGHAKINSSDAEETQFFKVATDQSTEEGYKASDLMYATAELTKTGSTVTGNLVFQHRMAKITANVTAGTGIAAIKRVSITCGCLAIAVTDPLTCTLSPYYRSEIADDPLGLYSIKPITMFNGSAATVNTSALIPPQTIYGSFLKIVTDQGEVTYALEPKALASGKTYTLNITVNPAVIGTTVPITGWTDTDEAVVNPADVQRKTPLGLRMLDLGMYKGGATSGKKIYWANMNIGAVEEKDFGTYFRWGEVMGVTVVGHYADQVAPDSKWQEFSWDYVSMVRIKDNVLMPGWDAACVNWGGRWRMPTKEEVDALAATETNTEDYTWEWLADNTFDDGYADRGVKITYKATGETLTLPMPRNFNNSSTGVKQGQYWLSSTDSGGPYSMQIKIGKQKGNLIREFNAFNGVEASFTPHVIRPVYEEE